MQLSHGCKHLSNAFIEAAQPARINAVLTILLYNAAAGQPQYARRLHSHLHNVCVFGRVLI